MPLTGMTERTLFRWATRHLLHQVQVEKLKGRKASAPGVPDWEDLGIYPGLYIEASGFLRGGDMASQAYSATVIIRSNVVFADLNGRYRLTVREYKGPREADPEAEDGPQLKRTRVVEPMQVDGFQDDAATDVVQVLRCINASQSVSG